MGLLHAAQRPLTGGTEAGTAAPSGKRCGAFGLRASLGGMRRRPQRLCRPSPALVFAALALFCALATTAWAAATLTGAQIKDGSLTSVDFAKGSKGLTGANVQDGSVLTSDLSAAARSALIEPMPGTPLASGETLSGELDWDSDGLAGQVSTFTVTVSAPRPLTGLIADASRINFAADQFGRTSDDDPACSGTAAAPSAPPGKVCLYLVAGPGEISSVRGMPVFELGATRGFAVSWDDPGQGHDSFLFFTWAYTAP